MRVRQSSPIIFLAFANDRERYLRNLPEETRRLQNTLERAQGDGLCELVIRTNATVGDMLDVFQRRGYRDRIALFHFGGHANDYQLLFETGEGQAAAADAGAFARFLGQQTVVKLVFLNGCSTQAQAQGLLDAGVSVVIATSRAIDDEVAREFADRFYKGLAGGATVYTAFKEAGAAVQTARGSTRDGGTRHLYAVGALEADLADCVPWVIYPPEGAPGAEDWSLSELGKVLQPRKPFEPETVHVPAGPFWMGSEPGEGVPEYEKPRHEVFLPAYRIGKYPVTHEQYAEFIQRSQSVAPPAGWWGNEPPPKKLKHPVAGVTWYDALAYCRWLSAETGKAYTLPSEAQWEKAARGTEGRTFPWGPEWDEGQHCNTDATQTTPVHAYPSGVSPYGCYDMVGNVREWTTTLWGDKPDQPDEKYSYRQSEDKRNDDQGLVSSEVRRVYRGRGEPWDPSPLRASLRSSQLPRQPGFRDARLGFRVVLKEE